MAIIFISLLIALLALTASILYQLPQRVTVGPCTFIWGALFAGLFVLAPLLLHAFAGRAVGIKGDEISDQSVYAIYAITVVMFALSYTILAFVRAGNGKAIERSVEIDYTGASKDGRREFENVSGKTSFISFASGVLVVVGLIVFVQGTNMSIAELFVASRFEWLEADSANNRLLSISSYSMSMITVFAYYDTRFHFPRPYLSLVVYFAILFMILLAGERKWILFVGSGWLAGYYDGLGRALVINAKFFSAAIAVTALAFVWQFGRTVEWQNFDSSKMRDTGAAFVETMPYLLEEGDATYFYRASLEAIRLNRSKEVLYPYAVIRRLILLPVPDEWTFGLKPEGVPFLFADELETGNRYRRGNQPPSVIGLFVLSFGWVATFALLPLIMLGCLCYVDRIVREKTGYIRTAMWATFTVTAILFMRGSTGGLYFMVANILWVLVLLIIYNLLNYSIRRILRVERGLRIPSGRDQSQTFPRKYSK